MKTHLLGACVALGITCLGVRAQGQTVTELPANPNSFPISIAQGPDGRIWYTDLRNRVLGAISLTQPAQVYPVLVTTPGGLCVGPDANLWFTGAPNGPGIISVGRMTRDGAFTLFPMPDGATLPENIISGPDGNLWYAEGLTHIGRVSTAGAFTVFTLPTANARPLSLTVGADGAIWFTEAITGKIGRIAMDGSVTEYPLPNGIALFLTAGPDGAIWFTQRDENRIGRLSTTGSFSSFPVPTPDSRPGRIIAGPDGNLWFGEDVGKIGRLTPEGVFTEFALPTFNPGILGLTVGADGAIWFAEGNVSQIGRISTGPCDASATTLCLGSRRFEVSVRWSVPSQGTAGLGAAVPLTADTGYFWFFSANNVELVVKVVDGRAFNGRYWVFGGALSNVQYTVAVRDTTSGDVRYYSNANGVLADDQGVSPEILISPGESPPDEKGPRRP